MPDGILMRSPLQNKKFRIVFKEGGHVDFGAYGMEDYRSHRDEKRKASYIARHGGMKQNWKRNGYKTAGFWSRWLLWNKPTLRGSARDIKKRFGFHLKIPADVLD